MSYPIVQRNQMKAITLPSLVAGGSNKEGVGNPDKILGKKNWGDGVIII